MKLTPPRAVVWWLCLLVLAVTVLTTFKIILVPALTGTMVFWMVTGALALLLLANVLPGL